MFDEDDQDTNHCSQFFAAWSSLSNILIPSTSAGLEHLKSKNFAIRSSWPKLLNQSKAEGLSHPFGFQYFQTRRF